MPQQIADKPSIPTIPTTIEQMQAHRKQFTAETGQLERRVRRVASATSKLAGPASVSDGGSDPSESRTISWPSSKSESSATPLSIRREIIPLPYSIEGFSGLRKVPPTAWTQRIDELVEEKFALSKSKSSSPTFHLTPGNLSPLNKTHRKVNDGFEVLPAGTLVKPAPVKEFGLWPEQSSKVVSDKDPKPMRKLQKRNRSHSGSCRSSSDGGFSDKEN